MATAPRRIVFLSGTRADFGKLKSLIQQLEQAPGFEVSIFATGMHMQAKYGHTVDEIEKSGFKNIYRYINATHEEQMDLTLAKTVQGFSDYCREIKPDLIVIHGDRVEALAGAITGALNNILVAHVEGGEVSGTIDELIRHAVSKLSHAHFVANEQARNRLVQMGEEPQSIFIIGSPDVDLMLSDDLPSLAQVRERYNIPFEEYGIVMFHPVTTQVEYMHSHAQSLVAATLAEDIPWVVIYPNNDMGSEAIMRAYEGYKGHANVRLYPSLRFEYFLTLLKHARLIVGNSSAGIREAPYYGVPVVNIGNRQYNRALQEEVCHCGYGQAEVQAAITKALGMQLQPVHLYGKGNSAELFASTLQQPHFWGLPKQKYFVDSPSFSLSNS